MASHSHDIRRRPSADSPPTVSSDDNYDANNESSSSPPSSSSSPMVLYSRLTLWGILRTAAINLALPFINGLMLGFGELLAHEAAFRLGWSETKVLPDHRRGHAMGPGIEIRDDPIERRRRDGEELDMYTSME